MTWLRIFVIVAFVVLFLFWAGHNLNNVVSINNFKGDTIATTPLWIVVLISVSFGMFFMGILGIVQEFRDKSIIRKLNIKIEKQQQELASLRNLPISDEMSMDDDIEEEPEKEVSPPDENES
ncbi:MAG: LapA family protein [Acidobacteria bacterium]|nr:LapA family protein [Acidobacteriota bacterium]